MFCIYKDVLAVSLCVASNLESFCQLNVYLVILSVALLPIKSSVPSSVYRIDLYDVVNLYDVVLNESVPDFLHYQEVFGYTFKVFTNIFNKI